MRRLLRVSGVLSCPRRPCGLLGLRHRSSAPFVPARTGAVDLFCDPSDELDGGDHRAAAHPWDVDDDDATPHPPPRDGRAPPNSPPNSISPVSRTGTAAQSALVLPVEAQPAPPIITHALQSVLQFAPQPECAAATTSRPFGIALRPDAAPSAVMDAADDVVRAVIPHVRWAGHASDVAHAFVRRGLRHEGVLHACLWRVFKWPGHGAALAAAHPAVRADIVSSTADMFRLMAAQALTGDAQMVLMGLGRIVECTPHMSAQDVLHTLEGLRLWNRLHFTVAEAVAAAANHDGANMSQDEISRGALLAAAGPQASVVDAVADRLERRLRHLIQERPLTAPEIVRIAEEWGHLGVRDPALIEQLAAAAALVAFTPAEVAVLLQHTVRIHERIVDVVSASGLALHDGGVDATLQACKPLFLEAAKKITGASLHSLVRSDPQLVLSLRRMCEVNTAVTAHVPMLWEAVRHVHVPQRTLNDQRRDREFGARRLPAAMDKPLHVRSVVDPKRDPRQFVPAAFRDWEFVHNHTKMKETHNRNRRLGIVPGPAKAAFGTQTIKRKHKQKGMLYRGRRSGY